MTGASVDTGPIQPGGAVFALPVFPDYGHQKSFLRKESAMPTRTVLFSFTIVGALVANTAAADAQATEVALPTDLLKNRTLVLRVSKEFIRQHTPAVVDRQTPVNRCLFGARVSGTAVTNGKPVMAKQPDDSQPMLALHFKGTTRTRTVATKDSVRVFSHGLAEFDVRREISFDGLNFQKGERTIDISYHSTITGLSTPPGLRGKITKAIAWPRIERQRPAAERIAREDAKRMVLAEFGKQTDKLVADLNANLPWKETVALLTHPGPGRRRQFSNAARWIEARSMHIDVKDNELPEESNRLRAPIELWVQGEPRASVTGQILGLWGAAHRALDRFREAVVPTDEATAKGVTPEIIGDWWVIRVGSDVAEQFIKQQVEAAKAEPAAG